MFFPLCVYSMLFLLPMYILYIYIYTHHWLSMSIYIDGRIYMHRFEYASICLYTQHALTLYILIYIHTYIYIYICIFILLAYSGTYGIWNVWICWIAYMFVFCFLPINASIDYIVREDKWSEGSTWRSLTAMMKEQNEVTATGKKLP